MDKKIRQEFADTMLEVGKEDPNLVVLVGDISHYILQPFAKACPGRFYNIGICEQSMVNLSAGLAKVGFIPVLHSITPFIIERSFEQLKLDFGYQGIGGNIICIGAAFDNGFLGCTHHCYDDFALLKNVENSQIVYPASCKEFNLLFKQTYNNNSLTYFRIPENKHNLEFKDDEIVIGKGIVIREGHDITIIALGPQLKTALDSVEKLIERGISPEIIYLHTIKPLDEELIKKSISKTKKCLVIEEHSQYGGVFEDILRVTKNLGEIRYSSINIGDKFLRRYCTYDQHCIENNFSIDGILNKVEKDLISINDLQ